MLISTSRKPSPKTRAFCKNLSNAFSCHYINRGKMSMRELQLKAAEYNCDSVVLVHEIEGNPSKITFFSQEGVEILAISGSVNTTNQRLNIKTDEIYFKSELSELDILKNIFPTLNNNSHCNNIINTKKNLVYVEKIERDDEHIVGDYNKRIAIIHFYNKLGKDTGLKINVQKVVS
jgi:U3 small nucleolar ribonucleoprotein protein IMP4